jgi:hypothetical protein
MTLSLSVFENELEAMLISLTSSSPPSADQAWADAMGNYFSGAVWAGNPVLTVAGAVTAMRGALVFANDGTAGDVLKAGFTAFWGAIVSSPATYWATMVLCIPPPGVATLDLSSVFSANQNPSITTRQAAENLAGALHPAVGLGGLGNTVPTPPPPPTSIT